MLLGYLWLFVLGLAAGSFIYLVALRYEPDKFLLSQRIIGGRSVCPSCRNKLTARELIPLVSFLLQRGRCRHCGVRVSFRYPVVELLSGLIFVLVPLALRSQAAGYFLNPQFYILNATLWVLIFLSLLLITLIDIRLRIIPDELNIFLIILGIALAFSSSLSPKSYILNSSYIGHYALLFGLQGGVWLNRIAALLFGLLSFGLLVFITRGRGMGMGDLKLTAALGVIFGWPDVFVITLLSFLVGSLVGLCGMAFKKQTLKSKIPFGPFLVLSAALVFFFGFEIVDWYFGLFGL